MCSVQKLRVLEGSLGLMAFSQIHPTKSGERVRRTDNGTANSLRWRLGGISRPAACTLSFKVLLGIATCFVTVTHACDRCLMSVSLALDSTPRVWYRPFGSCRSPGQSEVQLARPRANTCHAQSWLPRMDMARKCLWVSAYLNRALGTSGTRPPNAPGDANLL